MTLSLGDLKSVVDEISNKIENSVFLGLKQVDFDTVIVTFGRDDICQNVLICARRGASRIHLTNKGYPQQRTVSRFESKCNHVLSGFLVECITVLYGDRVCGIFFQKNQKRYKLVFECSADHPNLFLLNHKGIILSMLKPSLSKKRKLDVGCPYIRPIQNKISKLDVLHFLVKNGSVSEMIEEYYQRLDKQQQINKKISDLKRRLLKMIKRFEASAVQPELDRLKSIYLDLLGRKEGSIEEAEKLIRAYKESEKSLIRKGMKHRHKRGGLRGRFQ